MCPKSVYHTFISGTFADIEPLRNHVREELVSLGNQPVDLSLKKRSMGVKEQIDRELLESDNFVLLIGYRYGSRMEGTRDAPSWTHYEFHKFLCRVDQTPRGDTPPVMLIFFPDMVAEARQTYENMANEAMKKAGLTKQERIRDKDTLKYFMKLIEGGEIGEHKPDLINPGNGFVDIPVHCKPRSLIPFDSLDKISIALAKEILGDRVAREQRENPLPMVTKTHPVAPQTVTLTPLLRQHLAPRIRPAAFCVVATRLADHGIAAKDISAAIAMENPWDDEADDRLLDTAALSERTSDALLKALGEQEFGTCGDDRDTRIAEIVDDIFEDDMARMVCIQGIKERGVAKVFLKGIWPKLAEALDARRRQTGNTDAGLLLVIALELGPRDGERLCATDPGGNAPFLITPDLLELPAAPVESRKTRRDDPV